MIIFGIVSIMILLCIIKKLVLYLKEDKKTILELKSSLEKEKVKNYLIQIQYAKYKEKLLLLESTKNKCKVLEIQMNEVKIKLEQEKNQNTIHILSNFDLKSMLRQERELCIDLKKMLNSEKKNICSICFENTISKCCYPCGHTYCYNCITKANNCYICRQIIQKIMNIYIE
jgi:hypothetical protein